MRQQPSVDISDEIGVLSNLVLNSDIRNEQPKIPAAVTYLAQLIAHDIVPATNKKHLDRPIEDVSPYLNLDSIYGSCKHCMKRRYIIDAFGRFNYQRNRTIPFPYGFDFARTKDLNRELGQQDVANTPEQRNDENIIVSQFTVLWMRLHNMLLNAGYASSFQQAKEYVVKTFQLVCIEYVLANVAEQDVFKYYFRQVRHIPFEFDLANGLPVLFSHASFRFGHSMVRDEYLFSKLPRTINGRTMLIRSRFTTPEIFQKHSAITQRQYVDFEFLFTPNNKQMLAKNIDTKVVVGMSKIGQQTTRTEHLVNIVERNLQASKKVHLNSGKSIHRQFIDRLGSNLVGEELSDEALLQTKIPKIYFDDLPLWLYMLAEAEIQQRGKTLGKLCSTLNIEVLRASIAHCETSVYENDKYNYNTAIASMGNWGKQLSNLKVYDKLTHSLMQHIFKLIVDKEPK